MNIQALSMADVRYVLGATAVIFLLEILTLQLRNSRLRDLGVTALCWSVNTVTTRPLAAMAVAWLAAASLTRYKGVLSGVNFWIAYVALFVLMEFCFYWVHRWAHEGQRSSSRTGWLWKLHRTHHSSDHLNVSVTMRQNIFWTFFTPQTWIIGIATFLGLGAPVALALLTTYGWNLLTHTHWRWDDNLRRVPGVRHLFHGLQHIIVSPSMHHSHHGYGVDGKMFCNHAVTLSLFDWLFGTLHIPKGRPSRYGVPGGPPHWAEDVFYPLVRRKIEPVTPVTRSDQSDLTR